MEPKTKIDAHNRRVAKLDGSSVIEYYIWNDQSQLVGIADSSGALISRFVYGSKAQSPDYIIKNGLSYQIVTNHLGSPVAVVEGSTGNIIQERSYDEFGSILSDSNPGFIQIGFAGCLYDQDTKLCRFGARDYDSSIGRWLSKDPILFAGGDTNLYGYVIQDPINFFDPLGLTQEDIDLAFRYVQKAYPKSDFTYRIGTEKELGERWGMYNPFTNQVIMHPDFLKKLTSKGAALLLNTAFHEAYHSRNKFYMLRDLTSSGEGNKNYFHKKAYSQAVRDTFNYIDNYLIERKSCGY